MSLSCVDHLGNKYPSLKAMCKAYGAKYETVYYRICRGVDVESALAGIRVANGLRGGVGVRGDVVQTYKDHLGKEYPSRRVMCEAYGVHYGTFIARIKRGVSLEEALTEKRVRRKRPADAEPYKGRACVDHLGHSFVSESEMCRHYGISLQVFSKRRHRGWDLESALTGRHKRKIKDHLGNEYPSLDAMLRSYGVAPGHFYYWIKRGSSLEDILTGKTKDGRFAVIDPFGKRYPSLRAMCRAYGVSFSTYRVDIKKGLSMKDALTRKKGKGGNPVGHVCVDPLGQAFKSEMAMCRHYNIDYGVFKSRLYYGWTVKDALLTPVRKRRR